MYTPQGLTMITDYVGLDEYHSGVGHMASSRVDEKIRAVEKGRPQEACYYPSKRVFFFGLFFFTFDSLCKNQPDSPLELGWDKAKRGSHICLGTQLRLLRRL